MSDSEIKHTIHISFRQLLDGLHLVLVDGNLNKIVEKETHTLQLLLTKGIYQLKAFFVDYYEEYFLTIKDDETFILDFHYPMASPSMEFATTHEYFSNPAEIWSRKSTSSDIDKIPNFFFFAAAYEKNVLTKQETIADILANYSIFSTTRKLNIHFDVDNSFVDAGAEVVIFSTKLKRGMYFLKYKKKGERRIFPFYIYDDYQTQFLLRYKSSPDFANSFFYYDNKFGFSRTANQYLLLDKIQYAYKDYNNYELLTDSDRSNIKAHPYLVALVQILHLVTGKKEDSIEFVNVPILELPDIALLNALKDNEQQINSDDLPIISAIMAKCTTTFGTKMEFSPSSIMDRVVDHLSFDIFWNNFSDIEDISRMEELYKGILDKSKYYGISLKENRVVKTAKIMLNLFRTTPQILKEDRLNTLMGSNLVDKSKDNTKFIDAINSVGNVSEISNKFNIPPTTVLRNYEMYEDIYKKMNSK